MNLIYVQMVYVVIVKKNVRGFLVVTIQKRVTFVQMDPVLGIKMSVHLMIFSVNLKICKDVLMEFVEWIAPM